MREPGGGSAGEGAWREEPPAFELWRQRTGLIVAPIAFAAVWFWPTALAVPAHRLAAILAGVVILWVTEAIPMAMTAFLGVALAVLLGVASPREAFAPFADPLVFVFIGTFMIAQSIYFHRLDRRFAFAILALPGIGGRPRRVLAAYAIAAAAISMWISNMATTAMMLPIGVSLLLSLESLDARRAVPPAYGTALLLTTSLAASIGGLGTPVGTPPNLIGIGFVRRETGFDVPFFTWMALGVPLVAILLAWAIWRLSRTAGEGTASAEIAAIVRAERRALGPWTTGQINTLAVFAFTVALWVLPGLAALAFGQESETARALTALLPESVVAIVGAFLLFVLPTRLERHEFTLPWNEAVKIEWWVVFLFGGGIALGTLAFETGLAEALGHSLTESLGVRSELGLLALSTAIATLLSEATSNTASANMVVPVVIAFARSSGIDPVLPAIGATMGASLGFMMPVSTPCNAIVYGTGRVPLRTMMRYGIALDVIGVIAIVLVVGLLGPLVLERAG
jgi:sodium-dependent dicarboxylate transporter 2/3/5